MDQYSKFIYVQDSMPVQIDNVETQLVESKEWNQFGSAKQFENEDVLPDPQQSAPPADVAVPAESQPAKHDPSKVGFWFNHPFFYTHIRSHYHIYNPGFDSEIKLKDPSNDFWYIKQRYTWNQRPQNNIHVHYSFDIIDKTIYLYIYTCV